MPARPQRTCIGCRRKGDQASFLRIGRAPGGGMAVGRGGRGAYLCLQASCVEAAFRKGRLGRALRTEVPPDRQTALLKETLCRLK